MNAAQVIPLHSPGAAAAARVPWVEASDGSRASLEAPGGVEALCVRDARGRLVFEHRPAEGRSVVHAPEGDLELCAGGSVRISAGRGVSVEAPELTAKVARVEARLDEIRLVAQALTSTIGRVLLAADTLEVRVERLFEQAKEAYRDVEGLAQTRAGRLRLVAEETLHLLGRRALMKAREDVKLKGDKIYLG